MIKVGDLVKRVSRNNEIHYGPVIAIENQTDEIPGICCQVQWTNAKFSPTMDPMSNLEVISHAE